MARRIVTIGGQTYIVDDSRGQNAVYTPVTNSYGIRQQERITSNRARQRDRERARRYLSQTPTISNLLNGAKNYIHSALGNHGEGLERTYSSGVAPAVGKGFRNTGMSKGEILELAGSSLIFPLAAHGYATADAIGLSQQRKRAKRDNKVVYKTTYKPYNTRDVWVGETKPVSKSARRNSRGLSDTLTNALRQTIADARAKYATFR